MKIKDIAVIFVIFSFVNLNILPSLAITETTEQTKKQKMFQHKVKRNKKYNDDYKYTYVNLDFWKSFNDENLNNYIIYVTINKKCN